MQRSGIRDGVVLPRDAERVLNRATTGSQGSHESSDRYSLPLRCSPARALGRWTSGDGPSPEPRRIGELIVDAPQVLVDNEPVRGRLTLFDGDKVRTGDTGRATIRFDVGGGLSSNRRRIRSCG